MGRSAVDRGDKVAAVAITVVGLVSAAVLTDPGILSDPCWFARHGWRVPARLHRLR
jgi:hypothetical protein